MLSTNIHWWPIISLALSLTLWLKYTQIYMVLTTGVEYHKDNYRWIDARGIRVMKFPCQRKTNLHGFLLRYRTKTPMSL